MISVYTEVCRTDTDWTDTHHPDIRRNGKDLKDIGLSDKEADVDLKT